MDTDPIKRDEKRDETRDEKRDEARGDIRQTVLHVRRIRADAQNWQVSFHEHPAYFSLAKTLTPEAEAQLRALIEQTTQPLLVSHTPELAIQAAELKL